MKAKRRRLVSVWTKIICALYVFFVVVGLGYIGYNKFRFPRIFQVTDSPITAGEQSLSGTLRKDAPRGREGMYILVTKTGIPVYLEGSYELDPYLGMSIRIMGNVSTYPDNLPASMRVESLEVIKE